MLLIYVPYRLVIAVCLVFNIIVLRGDYNFRIINTIFTDFYLWRAYYFREKTVDLELIKGVIEIIYYKGILFP
jgi:hypothetical protein